jgi:hypothetical protein
MDAATQTSNDFGVDRYSYVGGVRCLVGRTRTIRPMPGETNGGFQARIDTLAAELLARHGVTSLDTAFELAAGGITQCVLTYGCPPRPEPSPADDPRPAGGRVVPMRGGRHSA